MLTAIALPYFALPLSLIQRHGLDRLAHERGGERELQFHFAAAVPLLPVWHKGQIVIARWGCRRDESRALPPSEWTRLARVETGYWSACGAEAVDIPAALGYDGGVWYAIRQGVRGVLVGDERGEARVYVVCEPASHYYGVMVRHEAWSRNEGTAARRAASTPAALTGERRAVGA